MNNGIQHLPRNFTEIQEATKKLDFDQVSDLLLGSLLSTLVATK